MRLLRSSRVPVCGGGHGGQGVQEEPRMGEQGLHRGLARCSSRTLGPSGKQGSLQVFQL